MTEPIHAVRITKTGPMSTAVSIDGTDIARSVRDLTLKMSAGHPAELTLDLRIFDATEVHDVDARILIPDMTRDALVALGWTPPADATNTPSDARPTADDGLRERITAALTAEHYRRARERIVASPEQHSAAMADVVVAALGAPSPTSRWRYRDSDGPAMHGEFVSMQAAIARVRALHTRTTVPTTGGPMEACEHCDSDGMLYPWPCDTIAALDGPATADAPWLAAREDDLAAETRRSVTAEAAIDRVLAQCAEWARPIKPSGARDGRVRDDIAASCAEMILYALDGPAPTPEDAEPTPDSGPTMPAWRGPIEGYGTGQMLGLLSGMQPPAVNAAGADGLPRLAADVLREADGAVLADAVFARCSPLVNPQCPGHFDGSRCAASNPFVELTRTAVRAVAAAANATQQDFVLLDADARCTAKYRDALSETWTMGNIRCDLAAGHDGDHAADIGNLSDLKWPNGNTDAPSEQQR